MDKIVATYIRTGNDTFLKGQAMRVQEYCEEKGYVIADSAFATGDRKLGLHLLSKMLEGAKEKGITTVVMDSTNRIARTTEEMIEVQKVLDAAGVSLETLDNSHLMAEALLAFNSEDNVDEGHTSSVPTMGGLSL